MHNHTQTTIRQKKTDAVWSANGSCIRCMRSVRNVVLEPQKHAKIYSKPVPLFDNKIANPHSEIELLTIDEVAGFLKISASTVRRLQQERHIPFTKVGGSVRFLKSDIVSYLERQRVESIGQ